MPRRILIVDDNDINRQILKNALENDYDIIEACDGEEALALIHRNHKILSAVLLDIVMPIMDGYEVLRRMRENAPLSQIPVIMVTGSDAEEARVRALALGANDFILKPFNPTIVKHCVRNCIALRETASILNAIQKDKLTGLYNREAFFDKANILIKGHEPGYYMLSCFDIDNFKLINDQYGAVEGDRILVEISNALKRNVEDIDGLAGRVSADNFVVLFPADKKDNDILQRIQSKNFVVVDQQSIVFSIGRYLITDTGLPASTIYDRAFIAKQSVKRRFDKHMAYFDDTMLEKLVRDQQIVGEMETALDQNQFEIWFQPQYNHVSGELIGAEALVRWRHPQKGIVPPSDFIPLFEQNGFIYELDKYVWRETCRFLRRWLDAGMSPLPVSVNISRYDIFRTDLISVITKLINEYDIPIGLLRLEITESAFAKSTKKIVEIVKQLVTLGFTIEIDDFGSGYSSLNTLKSVPAQVVKLDMRFLEDSDDEQRGGNILESIVRMIKWLGMSVIAEGVETKKQGDFLKSIGCSNVQGYLYARPMPSANYEAYFQNAARNVDTRLNALETVENLNNNTFWDPSSMDTLIFNNYVGAACICEYYNGKLELLRATDKYARMFGGEKMSIADLLKVDVMQYINPEQRQEIISNLDFSIRSKGEITSEIMLTGVPGCAHEICIKSTMRVIATSGTRYLIYCMGENVTEQYALRRKERRLTAQLTAIMDNVNCGITAFLLDGENAKRLLANDKYYELLGYTVAQYDDEIGENIYDTIHDDDKDRVAAISENTQKTGIPTSLEYRALRRDGSIIWIRSFLSMTEFEGMEGKVQLCTYNDITAEKNTTQNLLDNLPCGVGICTITQHDACMTYLNKRYYSYFKHRSRKETNGSVFEVVHPDDRAALRAAMLPALNNGGEGSCIVRIMDGQDEYITFRLTGVSMQTQHSENAIYVTFVPISHEEMTIGEMLPVALAAVMSSSSDLSFVKDKNLKYVCCSRPFAKMVGLNDEKDVVGKTDYDLFDNDLADCYVSDDNALIKNKKSIVNMIEKLPPENDKPRFSKTSKYLLYDSAGAVVGIYGVGRDVTQEREAKAQQKFLIDSIAGGVAVYEGRFNTIKDIKLVYFSDGFCKLFGYSREEYETLGKQNALGLVTEEYIPKFVEQIERLVKTGAPIDYVYRARVKSGGFSWIHVKAVVGERSNDNMTVNAVFFDITDRQNALEKLSISEEENRLALMHSKNVVCRYDVKGKVLKLSSNTNPIFEMSERAENVPYGQVEAGSISPETADAYIKFYENIMRGEKSGCATYQRKSILGWRWLEAHSSTIFSSENTPVSAVISFVDVTDLFEKDAAYKKWMQSLHTKAPETYSLFRCNISRDKLYDMHEGSLRKMDFPPDSTTFNTHTANYVKMWVYKDDCTRLLNFLNREGLIEKYAQGERALSLEYRENITDTEYRWLRLTVDLMELPHSCDVEAYLFFENIDKEKRASLMQLEAMQSDTLTGVLNRKAFADKVDKFILTSPKGTQNALFMMDIDGFKQINDVFGHSMGDKELISIAKQLQSFLRKDDFVGRLGGDEFVMFFKDMPNANIVSEKAKQLLTLMRKALSAEVQISGSIGIAMSPADGVNFDSLYRKADKALYHVKGSGRDNFAFYSDSMKDEHLQPEVDENGVHSPKKRRMLIVDDNMLDYEMLANMFNEDFIIEKAKDGNSALVRLRHYGSAISVVLLDLMMPGMDGFAVLEKMRQSPEMHTIPVVVVSGDDDRATNLKAIRAGASDFVTKPVDPDILRIRVCSAISKSENERLRLKNSLLEIQSKETLYYKAVLEDRGVFVIETDYECENFIYSPDLSDHLAGTYDGRSLFEIFVSDSVTDINTVNAMRECISGLVTDNEHTQAEIDVTLKTAHGESRSYVMSVCKLPEKLVLSFSEPVKKA